MRRCLWKIFFKDGDVVWLAVAQGWRPSALVVLILILAAFFASRPSSIPPPVMAVAANPMRLTPVTLETKGMLPARPSGLVKNSADPAHGG